MLDAALAELRKLTTLLPDKVPLGDQKSRFAQRTRASTDGPADETPDALDERYVHKFNTLCVSNYPGPNGKSQLHSDLLSRGPFDALLLVDWFKEWGKEHVNELRLGIGIERVSEALKKCAIDPLFGLHELSGLNVRSQAAGWWL